MSTYNRELSYDQEIETVKGIKFSVLSPDEIVKRSVVEVTKNDTFSGNEPITGGLFDPRMGVLETNMTCSTCQQKNLFCPGHFGHINLARPIYHPMFFDMVRKILKCVCYRCSRPLVSSRSTKEELAAEVIRISAINNQQKRWDALLKLHTKLKVKKCGDDHDKGDEQNSGCQAAQPSRYLKESSGLTIIAEWKESGGETVQREFTAEDVLRIFKRISVADMKLMGFDSRWNKPEWMICTVLPVPPPAVRPSIIEDSGQRREDDLTHKLCDIIKFNTQLRQRLESGKGTEEKNLKVLTNLVQYHVATFMDNQIPGMPVAQQRNGRKLKSISDRLKKKEGRIRGNLNGKRVDQSGRSVITPDPYIQLDELGVPIKIAMNLTFPEVVNQYNRAHLQELVRAGTDTWPGAKYVRRASDGVTISLKYAEKDKVADELANGDVVDRMMANGDYVLFNRQPSLHKMSMMGFKIRIMNYQTFRLPVLSTGCFNADFDGDEMNMFNPQNVQTSCEIKDIAAIPFQILNPRDAKPIVEVIQDTMVGSYRITKDWTTIDDKTMANLQMVNSYFNGVMPMPDAETHAYTGKQAFSMMLPPGLFIQMKNNGDEVFKIENSQLISGTLDKGVFHSMSKGIIPVLYHDYSPFEVRRFLDNLQRLMCRWLTVGGFSVGISDIVIDKETADKNRMAIFEKKKEAYQKFMDMRKGTFDNTSIFTNEENFEREMRDVLNALTKELGRMKLDEKTNRMINMIKSGSKGKELNVAQMVASVGQQNVDGKRVAYGFTDRTLPHYTKYDDGPDARGFVNNSFINGLTPQEVFFHAMGGREGLIDTAVRSVTWDTPVVVMEDGATKYVRIGEWIDARMKKDNDKVANFEERHLEYLKLDNSVYIPTGDEDGKITWGEITAMTRHDPGEKLYEIKTLGGRTVTVTEAQSLVIWNEKEGKFLQKSAKDVTIGDFAPSTAKLPEPPTIATFFDMSTIFPKDKYVYGSEYNKALALMKQAQGDKFHIPRGWWEANNGTTFTLPYPSKARFMRASVRSNTDTIHDGCVYPFHATREHCLMPDKFELNYDNGVFIGLFLADGNTDTPAGSVQITKENESVRIWTKAWFDKLSITNRMSIQQKEKGVSTAIVASSTLLARFLDAFVGVGSAHKHVPDIAFSAPEEFINGLLSGYLSGDGSVVQGGLEVTSVSFRLIEGISMLCTRLGIFSKVHIKKVCHNNFPNALDCAVLSIRSQWAQMFADKITLITDYKNTLLKTSKFTDVHRNFPEFNDVVMDKIVNINIIGVENNPKMYDLTVPSTLNFCLANGLIVADTSETGYIQRRLVKAMEDAKVYYDQTVRNATGALVQFLYGEDGMDGTKIEKQFIPYIGMHLIEIDNMYHLRPEDPLSLYLTDEAMSNLAKEADWPKRCDDHFQALLDDKYFLIDHVFKGQKKDRIHYPIPFERIINTAMKRMGAAAKAPTDITPGYILNKIDDMIDRLKVIRKNQGIRFMHILLRLHLSPKPVLMVHNMSKSIFDWVTDDIERHFIEAVVHPGEMVGVVAAQSIGELSTQQSVTKDTQIKIVGDKAFIGTIGEFVDTLLTTHADDVIDLGNGSTVLNLGDDYNVVGISTDEKTAWQRISQVSRHPANGGLMKVITRSGRSVTATLSHSFLKRGPVGIIPVLGSSLQVGDRIPVAKFIPTINTPTTEVTIGNKIFKLNKQFGWIVGAYLADGSFGHGTIGISKRHITFERIIREFGATYDITITVTESSKPNKAHHLGFKQDSYITKTTLINNMPLQKWLEANFGRGSFNKRVGACVYQSNLEFIAGIVSGYFDGDGNTNAAKQLIRAASVNENLVDDIGILLTYHGIFTTKSFQYREEVSSLYSVTVSRKYAKTFKDVIGLNVEHKLKGLEDIITYNESVQDTRDYVDMIPETDDLVADIAKALDLPDQSRMYGRYKRLALNRIGREAIKKYIKLFEAVNDVRDTPLTEVIDKVKLLKQAVDADAVYDEIVRIDYIPDNGEYVYDFSVPGNDSFMVNAGVLVHNTLDSFHSSGTAAAVKATSGVPRLKELLNVSKNIKTPAMFIYMKPDIGTVVNPKTKDENDKEVSDPRTLESKKRSLKIKTQIEVARIVDVLDSTEVYWDPPGPDGLATGITEDQGLLEVYRAFSTFDQQRCRSTSPWVLRIKINREKLYKIELTMMDIYMRLNSAYANQIDCIFSDDNGQELVILVRLTTEALKDVDSEDTIAALKAMEYNLVNSVLLKGVKGIKKVAMRAVTLPMFNTETDAFDQVSEWILDTDGTNLQEILANPNVDSMRTRSNDVYEVLNTLGIEAARNVLQQEFFEVVGEDSLNYRHMSLLLDTMTNRGSLMSVDRHGINRGDIGPLAKSSFEETTDMLIDASIFSQHDSINGVSANIMLGQLPPCGTGDHNIFIDEAEHMRLVKEYGPRLATKPVVEDYVEDYVEEHVQAPAQDNYTTDESCGPSALAFNFTMPQKERSSAYTLPKIVFT